MGQPARWVREVLRRVQRQVVAINASSWRRYPKELAANSGKQGLAR